MTTLPVFSPEEQNSAKIWLATRVVSMMGRKLEEGDWSYVYCKAKQIQPYFDVPPPSDPNLYYFKVQGEVVDQDNVLLWVSATTAKGLKDRLGSLEAKCIEDAILETAKNINTGTFNPHSEEAAVALTISQKSYETLRGLGDAVSDEHRAQLLLNALTDA